MNCNCSQFVNSKPKKWIGNYGKKDEFTTFIFGEAEEVTNYW